MTKTVLLLLGLLGLSRAEETACSLLQTGPYNLTLEDNACLVTPSTNSTWLVPIVADGPISIRYSENDNGDFSGYAWGETAPGALLCLQGNSEIFFDYYPEDNATIKVGIEEKKECQDHIQTIFHDNPKENEGKGVVWSTRAFYLKADSFLYKLNRDDAWAGATGVYALSETRNWLQVGWKELGQVLGQELRMGFVADGQQWRLADVVISNPDDSVHFGPFQVDIGGPRNSCYQRSSLTLHSVNPETQQRGEIRFENLTLAAFLPWNNLTQDDSDALVQCLEYDHSQEPVHSEVPAQHVWYQPEYFMVWMDHLEFGIPNYEEEALFVDSVYTWMEGTTLGDYKVMHMSIQWENGEVSYSLGAIFSANETHWFLQEARYGMDHIRETFLAPFPAVVGELGSCTHFESLALHNDYGAWVKFGNLLLVPFLSIPSKGDVIEQARLARQGKCFCQSCLGNVSATTAAVEEWSAGRSCYRIAVAPLLAAVILFVL